MWPPCQEEWRHEVPKTAKPLTPHSISGTARINLTFRSINTAWEAAVPPCRCGRRSVMKSRLLQGGCCCYYYACDNTQGPGCGFYAAAGDVELTPPAGAE
ncbi:hypothetical protein OEZ86_010021 [Tetradesmus obliquus]|uniref:Pherophorin domain-containing protein n=1 Tax=Tetradesmus obliquus TaxID=3088 RepID=A0ABY8UQ90_TETOB|nr:hypothetical protein OEZ85_001456 [Tetradesmus obliquus]WIA43572.1 hypothetical protein OEZ86_010021 [Tetradesmus obliquus]